MCSCASAAATYTQLSSAYVYEPAWSATQVILGTNSIENCMTAAQLAGGDVFGEENCRICTSNTQA
jgi:hypothetical protein